ncbi:MAG: Appr-1-p processing protein [Planctomycetota bacterium]|nr:MAG: Appr-1-p processing protein [Planctomycetota bacterium]
MIEYTRGNILDSDAEALVNTVNCVGIMGRGIALQFKKAFPANFKAYAAACRRGEVRPGRLFVHETGRPGPPRYIINFPTKRHWRSKSRLEDIEAGLQALARVVRERAIRSIALPPLGCGLGGLSWREVRQRMESALEALQGVRIVVYEPQGAPPCGAIPRTGRQPRMTPARAALIGLMDRYLAGLLDPFVTLLEVHKLTYFMQAAGEPLRLRFRKGHYGPYAENLRHVLHAIEGHLIVGYGDGGDRPDKRLKLMPGAVDEADKELARHPETRARFQRVAQLVEGFESPFGLELLATVHWVMTHQGADNPKDVEQQMYAWNRRKRRFTPRQIALAVGVLRNRDWLAVR